MHDFEADVRCLLSSELHTVDPTLYERCRAPGSSPWVAKTIDTCEVNTLLHIWLYAWLPEHRAAARERLIDITRRWNEE